MEKKAPTLGRFIAEVELFVDKCASSMQTSTNSTKFKGFETALSYLHLNKSNIKNKCGLSRVTTIAFP